MLSMSAGAPAHEQSGIMSNTAGAVLGKEEVFNETVTVNSTARAELQAAGIDMAFHDLLLAAGLDLETLKVKPLCPISAIDFGGISLKLAF